MNPIEYKIFRTPLQMPFAEMFPNTRFEWLLGKDDIKSQIVKKFYEVSRQISEYELFKALLKKFAAALEYDLIEKHFEDLEKWREKLRNKEFEIGSAEFIEAHNAVSFLEKEHKNEKYDVYFKGEKIMSCGEKDIELLTEEVKHFIKFRLIEFTKQDE